MPPKGLGLRWRLVREINTRAGYRILWNASSTTVFETVYRVEGSMLSSLGFSRDSHRGGIAFWEKPGADETIARGFLAIAVVRARSGRASERTRIREARIEQAREAERRKAEMEVRRVTAAEGIRRILSERRWAIHHRYLDEVERFAQIPVLDDAQTLRAEAIVRSTDQTVEKARAALQEPAPIDDERFCQDPLIRDLILSAVRHITHHDADWAALRNDIGWSKATTVIGHVLAMEDALPVGHAAHALKLLRVHRKQVAPDLRESLRIGA